MAVGQKSMPKMEPWFRFKQKDQNLRNPSCLILSHIQMAYSAPSGWGTDPSSDPSAPPRSSRPGHVQAWPSKCWPCVQFTPETGEDPRNWGETPNNWGGTPGGPPKLGGDPNWGQTPEIARGDFWGETPEIWGETLEIGGRPNQFKETPNM